jgi:hypothetical protein
MDLVLGDFDGDQDLDVATADNGWWDFGVQAWKDCGVSVLHNQGNGQFSRASSTLFAAGHSAPTAVAAGPAARGAACRPVCLVLLGGLAARTGGARPVVGALRVVFWGALARR